MHTLIRENLLTKLKKMKSVHELLEEYLENTPNEKIKKDWDSLAHFDKTGSPTVNEFLERNKKYLFDLEESKDEKDQNISVTIKEKSVDYYGFFI